MNKTIYKMDLLEHHDSSIVFNFYITAIIDDERSIEALKIIQSQNISIDNLIVLNYFNNDLANKLVQERFEHIAENIIIIDSDMYDPILNVKETIRVIKSKGWVIGYNLGLDITGIPVPTFFLMTKLIKDLTTFFYVHYTEPLIYNMDFGKSQSYSSTIGPVNTDEIRGYEGLAAKVGNNERILYCILGFDNDLIPEVIKSSVPNKIITINGFPSYFPKFKDLSLINNEEILSGEYYATMREKGPNFKRIIYAEANNPFEVANTLLQLKKKNDDMCIDVVPMGTKPMALGVCLFALANEDVRVIYPFPEKYEHKTSRKVRKTWEYLIY